MRNKFGNKYKNATTKIIQKLIKFVCQIQNYRLKLLNIQYLTKVSIKYIMFTNDKIINYAKNKNIIEVKFDIRYRSIKFF